MNAEGELRRFRKQEKHIMRARRNRFVVYPVLISAALTFCVYAFIKQHEGNKNAAAFESQIKNINQLIATTEERANKFKQRAMLDAENARKLKDECLQQNLKSK